ncbi:MAG: hypothetical protein ACI9R3_001077 [Verrucomicrobiales bacterium]|jgi:hypothetical protein
MRVTGKSIVIVILAAYSVNSLAASVSSSDDSILTIVPVLVTSDTAGSHTTTNGINSFTVDHHGVGRMVTESSNCTSSLLSDGRSVLTAAHCVTGTTSTATFINAAGASFSQSATGSARAVNPGYDGNVGHGFDTAVITFPTTFDPSIPRYEIVSIGYNALGQRGVIIGFGQSGIGTTGATIGLGTKRAGLIEYESLGLGTRGEPGFLNDNTQLVSDFDSGLAENDAFNDPSNVAYSEPADLGFGDDEVGFGVGDSGGPTFFLEGGIYRIGAVSSWVAGGGAADSNASVNFTYGEFNGSANLGDATMNLFVLNAIPEPGSLSLLAVAFPLALLRRKRQTS